MSLLWEPLQIGSLKLRNRLMRSATAEYRADPMSGAPDDRLAPLYRALAVGEVGLIVTGHVCVSLGGRTNRWMASMADDSLVAPWARTIRPAQQAGGRVMLQINHGAASIAGDVVSDPVSPSGVATNELVQPRALRAEEIPLLAEAYGQAARRAREAGFDGVQLHGAHGYLISQFLTPSTNQRDDVWGGDDERRLAFLRAVNAAVRAQVGQDFPVWIKLGLAGRDDSGLTMAMGERYALACSQMGLECLEISHALGVPEALDPAIQGQGKGLGEAPYLPMARAARTTVGPRQPLALVAGFRHRRAMEQALAEGAVQLISLCRPFIADPNLARNLRLGLVDQVDCTRCDRCRLDMELKGVNCNNRRVQKHIAEREMAGRCNANHEVRGDTMGDVRQGAGRFGDELSSRERFNRTMHYQHVDYVSNLEFGYWDELKQDWMEQGHLPKSLRLASGAIPDRAVEEHFGIEQFEGFNPRVEAYPRRQQQVIERKPGSVIYRDEIGVLIHERGSGTRTIPHFLEFPIRDRVSWEAFRDEFLDPDHLQRPLSAEELARGEALSRTSTNPVRVHFGSFIGRIRDWVGFEGLALLSLDDPDLVEEMVAHVAALMLHELPPVLERGQFDLATGWEDICFNSGPILSPKFFAQRIMPHMQPVMRLLRQHGIDVIWTDCDGNILRLIPLWLGVGLNCMFPLEVNPGNDPVALKKEYGRDLLIAGGVNKFVLHQGREAILQELERLEPLVADGGFIPHIDHRAPAEVPYDTYCYYIWEKCHLLGWPEARLREAPAFRHWRP
jgi:uroporphyrinogen decarboxylase